MLPGGYPYQRFKRQYEPFAQRKGDDPIDATDEESSPQSSQQSYNPHLKLYSNTHNCQPQSAEHALSPSPLRPQSADMFFSEKHLFEKFPAKTPGPSTFYFAAQQPRTPSSSVKEQQLNSIESVNSIANTCNEQWLSDKLNKFFLRVYQESEFAVNTSIAHLEKIIEFILANINYNVEIQETFYGIENFPHFIVQVAEGQVDILASRSLSFEYSAYYKLVINKEEGIINCDRVDCKRDRWLDKPLKAIEVNWILDLPPKELLKVKILNHTQMNSSYLNKCSGFNIAYCREENYKLSLLVYNIDGLWQCPKKEHLYFIQKEVDEQFALEDLEGDTSIVNHFSSRPNEDEIERLYQETIKDALLESQSRCSENPFQIAFRVVPIRTPIATISL